MTNDSIRSRMRGNIVPIPAQYNKDLSINYSAVQEHVKFLLSKGVNNFYLAMSASEFDYMTRDERVNVTKCVAKTLNSDCILLTQALGGNWIEDHILETKMLSDAGAHAIVIAPRGIKEGGKFFSSIYKRGRYTPERHNDYFIAYIQRIATETDVSIVYHDKPFKNGLGPSIDMLIEIANIDNVVAIKEHVSDPGVLHKVYGALGEKVVCFDGFGKSVQFWSIQWGAKARHTCWSWFDPDTDNLFFQSVKDGNLNKAAQIINAEWPVAEAIIKTGFQGYKYIMELMGLPSGPVRIPGENINEQQKEMIKKAIIQFGLLKEQFSE